MLDIDLTRPIIGIENRTAHEVFEIMADRIRSALSSPVGGMEETFTRAQMLAEVERRVERALLAKRLVGEARAEFEAENATPASDIAALREENEAQRVEIETARTFESLWKNHRDELLQQNEELIDELAATYEELINHNGDDLNDTRAQRVAELRSLQHVAKGERG